MSAKKHATLKTDESHAGSGKEDSDVEEAGGGDRRHVTDESCAGGAVRTLNPQQMNPSTLNYLLVLSIDHFEHLFRFLRPQEIYGLSQAYLLSHQHNTGGCNVACEEFQNFCRRPIWWKKVTLTAPGQRQFGSQPSRKIILTDRQIDMLSKFGPRCEHVVLESNCYFIDVESLGQLNLHIKTPPSALRRFTLRLFVDTLQEFYEVKLFGFRYHDTDDLSTLMNKMSGMGVSVSLEVTFGYNRTDYVLMRSLYASDPFYRYATSLKLTESCPSERLIRYMTKAPAEAPSVELLSRFSRLCHLQLGVFNLSDQLLQMFARTGRGLHRAPLQTLTIIFPTLLYIQSFPELSAAAWRALTVTSPELEVSCIVRHLGELRYVHRELSRVLKSIVPVVNVTVDGTKPENLRKIIILICERFLGTLKRFTCKTIASFDTSEFDQLVERLPNRNLAIKNEGLHSKFTIT